MAEQQQSAKPLAVSVKTACALLDIGNTKMWELIGAGRIETTTIGRKRLVIYASLERLLAPASPLPRGRGRPRKIAAPPAADRTTL